MAEANGSSVTPEEVEALRQQLETLQVGQCVTCSAQRRRMLPPPQTSQHLDREAWLLMR
jgi:hypothetical protein